MKHLISLVTVILLALSSCEAKIDIVKEKEAIKAVIEEERAAFFDRDFSRVEATWKQESTSRKIYMFEQNGAWIFGELKGWTEIAKSDKENIDEGDFWNDIEDWDNEYFNIDINVYGNTALVFHDAKFSGKQQGEEIDDRDKRILHLVKIGGKWKLDLMALYGIPK